MYNLEHFLHIFGSINDNITTMLITDDVDELMKMSRFVKKQIDKLCKMKRAKLFGLDKEE